MVRISEMQPAQSGILSYIANSIRTEMDTRKITDGMTVTKISGYGTHAVILCGNRRIALSASDLLGVDDII